MAGHCPGAQVVNLRKSRHNISCGRPSNWGNPYRIGKDGSRCEVIAKYRGISATGYCGDT